MKKRVDSLTRIGRLASQMHDLGTWRLSAIEQEQASLSDDLRAVFEALESGDLAYGAQAKLGARRIRGLAEAARRARPANPNGSSARRTCTGCGRSSPSAPPRRPTRPIASMRRARSSPTSSSARSCAATQARGKAACEGRRGSSSPRRRGACAPSPPRRAMARRSPRDCKAMAFNPTTDVVLEVLNAADPARASLAAERLAALALGRAGARFHRRPRQGGGGCRAPMRRLPRPASPMRATRLSRGCRRDRPGGQAKVEFEAMALNSFVGEMLPKDVERLLRTGNGGRHLALDARRADFAADRQVRRAGPEPAPVRHPRASRRASGEPARRLALLRARTRSKRAPTSCPRPPAPTSSTARSCPPPGGAHEPASPRFRAGRGRTRCRSSSA